jgi:hypothetical protein
MDGKKAGFMKIDGEASSSGKIIEEPFQAGDRGKIGTAEEKGVVRVLKNKRGECVVERVT